MGIDVTPGGLMREVNAYRSATQSWRTKMQNTVAEYETPAASGDVDTTAPENFKFRFTLHTTARNMSGRPYVRLETRNPIGEQRIADLSDSANAWIQSTHYDEVRQRVVADQCLLDQSIVMVAQRPRPGFEQNDDPPKTPSVSRVPPEMYMIDVYAQDKRGARIEGHAVIVDRDDLLREKQSDKEGGWKLDVIARLAPDGPVKDYRPGIIGDIQRKEIVYWELWVPGHTLNDVDPEDKHYHGTVFCVAIDQEPVFIREPRPYFGPREGPYAIGGTMVVPGKARYISILTAAESRIQQYNAQSRANDTAARNRKSLAIIDSMVEGLNPAIASAYDGQLVPVPGIAERPNSVQKVEVGGVTVEARTREMELRSSVERDLALSDALQGSTTGNATATENLIAARAGANVASLIDGGVENSDVETLRRVLWYLDNDYRSMVTKDGEVLLGGNTYADKKKALEHAVANGAIDPEQAEQGLAMLDKQEGPMGTLDDLEVYVDCVRADAAEEARLTVGNNMLLQWAPLLLEGVGQFMPGLQDFFDRAGRSLRVPEIGKALDVAGSAQVFQEMQEAEAAAAQEPRSAPAAAPPRQVQSQSNTKPKSNTSPIKMAAKAGTA